jgi:hypothetical protein
VDGERVTGAALGPRAFCRHDWDLIGDCARDLPGIFLRLAFEVGQPAVTDTQVHVPFGPSVPVRLDVDAAMRLTATRLAMWAARVRAIEHLEQADPLAPVVDPAMVRDAAATLAGHLSCLLALQPAPATRNFPLRPGRHGQQAPISDDLLAEHGDAVLIRMGADFIGLEVPHDGAMAGLEILHLHYWDRAVLRETPARTEELLGVECRSPTCSALALRRAQPAWHSGDPDYFSECAVCGDLQTEDEYRLWTGQLAAYHRARQAAMPTLAPPPVLAGGVSGHGGKA